MTESDLRFARAAVRRGRIFLILSFVGIAVAIGLAIATFAQGSANADHAVGPRAVIVLLLLLNARQNLRQFKYARVLSHLLALEPMDLPRDPGRPGC